MFGITEIALILVLIAVFFGGARVPQVMASLGQGVKQFRDAAREVDSVRQEVKDTFDPRRILDEQMRQATKSGQGGPTGAPPADDAARKD